MLVSWCVGRTAKMVGLLMRWLGGGRVVWWRWMVGELEGMKRR